MKPIGYIVTYGERQGHNWCNKVSEVLWSEEGVTSFLHNLLTNTIKNQVLVPSHHNAYIFSCADMDWIRISHVYAIVEQPNDNEKLLIERSINAAYSSIIDEKKRECEGKNIELDKIISAIKGIKK